MAINLQLHNLSKITHFKRKFQHKIVTFKNIYMKMGDKRVDEDKGKQVKQKHKVLHNDLRNGYHRPDHFIYFFLWNANLFL